jgi:hypothetical protein
MTVIMLGNHKYRVQLYGVGETALHMSVEYYPIHPFVHVLPFAHFQYIVPIYHFLFVFPLKKKTVYKVSIVDK